MFSKERFLGVDVGTESIKAVELGIRGGKPVVTNYGEVSLFPESSAATSARSLKEEIAYRFRALLERMQPETEEICLSMPSFLGLISLIELPRLKPDELEEAVQFEARKYIPSPLEDVSLSWDVIEPTGGKSEGGQEKTEVLLVAALNKDVRQYENYVDAVGRKMKLLELETFSITRALAPADPEPVLVVDIGARAANIVLIENGFPKKSRSIDAGGREITKTLAESLNISVDRADEMKKGKKDFLNARDVALILTPIETIISESQRLITLWEDKHPDRKVGGVILSGGTAKLTGLSEYFSKKVGLPVNIGNPFEGIGFPSEIDEAVRERLGSSFSAAVGLALYGLKSTSKR